MQKKLLLLVMVFFISFPGRGQFIQQVYSETGASAVSDGMMLNLAGISSYSFQKFTIGTGYQFSFFQEGQQLFSGWFGNVGTLVNIHDFSLMVNGFMMINPYSSLTRETNFGLFFSHYWDHFLIRLGNNTRIYGLDPGELPGPALPGDADTRIWEYRNLMYQFAWYLKSYKHPWNVGAGVLNFDNFRITQETNPMVSLSGWMSIKNNFRLYTELYYLRAGTLNLTSEHYAVYFRIGGLWIPGLK